MTAQIKVGDIIGNTVKGFDWKVLKVLPDGGFEVKNLDTGEKKIDRGWGDMYAVRPYSE